MKTETYKHPDKGWITLVHADLGTIVSREATADEIAQAKRDAKAPPPLVAPTEYERDGKLYKLVDADGFTKVEQCIGDAPKANAQPKPRARKPAPKIKAKAKRR